MPNLPQDHRGDQPVAPSRAMQVTVPLSLLVALVHGGLYVAGMTRASSSPPPPHPRPPAALRLRRHWLCDDCGNAYIERGGQQTCVLVRAALAWSHSVAVALPSVTVCTLACVPWQCRQEIIAYVPVRTPDRMSRTSATGRATMPPSAEVAQVSWWAKLPAAPACCLQ